MHSLNSKEYMELYPDAQFISDNSAKLKSEKVKKAYKPRTISQDTRDKIGKKIKRISC